MSPGSSAWPRSVPPACVATPFGSASFSVSEAERSSITIVRRSRAAGCSSAIRRWMGSSSRSMAVICFSRSAL